MHFLTFAEDIPQLVVSRVLFLGFPLPIDEAECITDNPAIHMAFRGLTVSLLYKLFATYLSPISEKGLSMVMSSLICDLWSTYRIYFSTKGSPSLYMHTCCNYTVASHIMNYVLLKGFPPWLYQFIPVCFLWHKIWGDLVTEDTTIFTVFSVQILLSADGALLVPGCPTMVTFPSARNPLMCNEVWAATEGLCTVTIPTGFFSCMISLECDELWLLEKWFSKLSVPTCFSLACSIPLWYTRHDKWEKALPQSEHP